MEVAVTAAVVVGLGVRVTVAPCTAAPLVSFMLSWTVENDALPSATTTLGLAEMVAPPEVKLMEVVPMTRGPDGPVSLVSVAW